MDMKKILFATDFSAGSAHAAYHAADLARRYEATLYIVHVIQDMGKMTEWYAPKVNLSDLQARMEEKSQQELQKCCTEGLGGYKNVEYRLLTGVPYEEILKFQKENDISLIVIGTGGRAGSGENAVFGSTADRVVKNSPCPVLTVTPSDEEPPESTDPKLCSDGEIRL